MSTGAQDRPPDESGVRSQSLRRFGGHDPRYHPDDAQLVLQVRRALLASCPAVSGPVQVSVQDGVVHLRGAVSSQGQMVQIYKAARSVPGIQWVCNDMTAPRRPGISRAA